MATENHAGVQVVRVDPETVIAPATAAGTAPVAEARPYPMRPLRTLMAPDSGALLKPEKDAIFWATGKERKHFLSINLAEDAGKPKAEVNAEIPREAAATKAKAHGKGGEK